MKVMRGLAAMAARVAGMRRTKGSSQAWRIRVGDGDAVEDAGGGGAVVVVVGRTEAGVERGDAVVEVAQGAEAGAALGVEDVREQE